MLKDTPEDKVLHEASAALDAESTWRNPGWRSHLVGSAPRHRFVGRDTDAEA